MEGGVFSVPSFFLLSVKNQFPDRYISIQTPVQNTSEKKEDFCTLKRVKYASSRPGTTVL